MIDCIQRTSIPVCTIGLLTALQGTQLSRRLMKEGRLLPLQYATKGDQCTGGLNFVPLGPRLALLRSYEPVRRSFYPPAPYFERFPFAARSWRRPRLGVPSTPA